MKYRISPGSALCAETKSIFRERNTTLFLKKVKNSVNVSSNENTFSSPEPKAQGELL